MASATTNLEGVEVGGQTSAKIALAATYASIFLTDLFALCAAGTAAVILRHLLGGEFEAREYLSFYPCVLVLLVSFGMAGLYPALGTNPIDEFRSILRSATVGFIILAGASALFREASLASRGVFLLAWAFTIILVPLCRRIARGRFSNCSWWGVPVVIIGDATTGQTMLELLEGHRRLGLRPIAFLGGTETAELPQPSQNSNIIHGHPSLSASIARMNPGAYAVLSMPSGDSREMNRSFREHIRMFRKVLIIPPMMGMRSLSITTTDLGGVLTLRVNQNLAGSFSTLAKRVFDIIVASVIGLFVIPLFVLLYLMVKFTSDGPAFYDHKRLGKDGQVFYVKKLRTMVVNSDEVLEAALQSDVALLEEWNRDHKLKQDPRVTSIGKFLRKSSLDELPQLWNVLRGDMSLVGPRPIVQPEIEKYGDCYEQYVLVRPGITGLWQISGRNNTSYDLRTRIDDYYITNWSFTMDLYILLRTAKTLLLREGAY